MENILSDELCHLNLVWPFGSLYIEPVAVYVDVLTYLWIHFFL